MSVCRADRHVRLVAALVIGIVVLAGCFTGQRPSFSDDHTAPGTDTGDEAIDAVLDLLDSAGAARFAASYDVLTRYGSVTSEADVSVDGPNRRSVRIGDVRFTVQGDRARTCPADEARCVDRLDDRFISNLQITHRFWAADTAARLRQDATNRVGDAEAWSTEYAGQQATCVTVTVAGGSKRYCALDSGVLALRDGPEVLIELTSFSVDPSHTDVAAG